MSLKGKTAVITLVNRFFMQGTRITLVFFFYKYFDVIGLFIANEEN